MPATDPQLTVLSVQADKPLQSAKCHYYDFTTIGSANLADELNPHNPPICDVFPIGTKDTQCAAAQRRRPRAVLS